MFVRLSKVVTAIALAMMLGAHWMLLQSVAWMGMIVCYSEHAPLKEALVCTFDGKHPCPLCKAIAAAKKSEKKTDSISPAQKFEFPLLKERFAFMPPAAFRLLPMADCFADCIPQKPPVPPPRGCFV